MRAGPEALQPPAEDEHRHRQAPCRRRGGRSRTAATPRSSGRFGPLRSAHAPGGHVADHAGGGERREGQRVERLAVQVAGGQRHRGGDGEGLERDEEAEREHADGGDAEPRGEGAVGHRDSLGSPTYARAVQHGRAPRTGSRTAGFTMLDHRSGPADGHALRARPRHRGGALLLPPPGAAAGGARPGARRRAARLRPRAEAGARADAWRSTRRRSSRCSSRIGRPVVLIGQSMGCQVVLEAAAPRPRARRAPGRDRAGHRPGRAQRPDAGAPAAAGRARRDARHERGRVLRVRAVRAPPLPRHAPVDARVRHRCRRVRRAGADHDPARVAGPDLPAARGRGVSRPGSRSAA